jgi:predicted DNA-binding transcriptional regulator AlpA
MPKSLPRVPHVDPPFILRAELLTVVPHSMATIDRLEADGQFPRRIKLVPTARVAWLRREVIAYLRQLAKRGRTAVPEDQGGQSGADHNLSPAEDEAGGHPEVQPASPDHQFAPARATLRKNPNVSRR